jgi:sRNA-binding regulator protein Hfq
MQPRITLTHLYCLDIQFLARWYDERPPVRKSGTPLFVPKTSSLSAQSVPNAFEESTNLPRRVVITLVFPNTRDGHKSQEELTHMAKRIISQTEAEGRVLLSAAPIALLEEPRALPILSRDTEIKSSPVAKSAAPSKRSRAYAPPASVRHHVAIATDDHGSNRQAELFYLQKQIQQQTQMIFILEDGSRVQGVVEWYDRNTIKVRGKSRVLIYKSAIKYLYKAGEIGSAPSVQS